MTALDWATLSTPGAATQSARARRRINAAPVSEASIDTPPGSATPPEGTPIERAFQVKKKKHRWACPL